MLFKLRNSFLIIKVKQFLPARLGPPKSTMLVECTLTTTWRFGFRRIVIENTTLWQRRLVESCNVCLQVRTITEVLSIISTPFQKQKAFYQQKWEDVSEDDRVPYEKKARDHLAKQSVMKEKIMRNNVTGNEK